MVARASKWYPPFDPPPFVARDWFAQRQVFRIAEYEAAHLAAGRPRASIVPALSYAVKAGHLQRVRRGLYAVPGMVDPWVLGSLLTSDAVLAYDGALSFHGLTGLGYGISVLSWERLRHFHRNEVVYRSVQPAATLGRRRALKEGVITAERNDREVRVTSIERTLVDVFDRLELVPSTWQAIAAPRAAPASVSGMVEYAERLAHPLTAARLGLVLEHLLGASRRGELKALRRLAPKTPTAFDQPSREERGHVSATWNVVYPHWLLEVLRAKDPSASHDHWR